MDILWDIFHDRYSGHINWIAVGVAFLLAIGVSNRVWLVLRPQDTLPKVLAKCLTVFVFVGGGCLLLYFENIVEKFRLSDIHLIDLLGFAPLAGGLYFIWDFFIRNSTAKSVHTGKQARRFGP